MKMNKKGFTLIELLAVIIILAIIALIATPIIMSVIRKAQEGANLRSVEAYGKAVESAYYQYAIEHKAEYTETLSALTPYMELSGNQPTGCTVIFDDAKVSMTGCVLTGGTSTSYTYTSDNGAVGVK